MADRDPRELGLIIQQALRGAMVGEWGQMNAIGALAELEDKAMALDKLRANSHANPLVLESHAQLLASHGYEVQAKHVRLLSLAIHKPEEYQREHDRLRDEAKALVRRDHRYYDDARPYGGGK